MDILIKIAVYIFISSNLLFTFLTAVYTFIIKIEQGQYIVSFFAFMTIVFIINLLVQLIKGAI